MLAHDDIWAAVEERSPLRKNALPKVLLLGGEDPGVMQSRSCPQLLGKASVLLTLLHRMGRELTV